MVNVRVEQRALKAQLDDAVATLGISIRDHFAPELAAELGRTRYKEVRPAQGHFAEYDFASHADCLIGDNERTRSHRDLFRRIAAQRWTDYGDALLAAKRARNTIIHPGRLFDRRSAAQLIEPLAAVSTALKLSSGPQLAEQVEAIRSGHFASTSRPTEEDVTRAQVLAVELDREKEAKAATAEAARPADERANQHAAARRRRSTALRRLRQSTSTPEWWCRRRRSTHRRRR
ncbi:MAG: hypothetical protein ABI873_10170 [Marmoricola sp.]